MEPLNRALNIGDASKATGVSAKMIRHYESIGLIPKAKRTYSGYRLYAENELHELRFIRAARDLGFSIASIGELLKLWRDKRRPSTRVKALALEQISMLEARIRDMQAMKATLERLAHHCHGDERPDCPILEELATADAATARPAKARRSHAH